MECTNINNCKFIKTHIKSDIQLLQLYKQEYCLNRYTDCARWYIGITLDFDSIPDHMYPNMMDKAYKYIRLKLEFSDM